LDDVLNEELGGETSEDCLFLNIWAPSNASSINPVPVYVFINGGGFGSDSNANMNGSNIVIASGKNVAVVNFNYRVGPYGFLAAQELVDHPDTTLNVGLLDQRQALKWVQQHIGEVKPIRSTRSTFHLL
jgi:carboxylesterase type B